MWERSQQKQSFGGPAPALDDTYLDHSDTEDRWVLLGMRDAARALVAMHCKRADRETIHLDHTTVGYCKNVAAKFGAA